MALSKISEFPKKYILKVEVKGSEKITWKLHFCNAKTNIHTNELLQLLFMDDREKLLGWGIIKKLTQIDY